MKLTGELKEKVANAESAEQAKELIAEAGVELTDEEVEEIAGGTFYPRCLLDHSTLKAPDPVIEQTTPPTRMFRAR